jgi:HEAT repeat protein
MKDIVFAAQEPLNHSGIELVGESIALLMAIDPKVGRPLIEPLLHHPSEMIRAGVVTQLAEKGDLTFVPSISKALLEDMDGTVRYCAVAALEYIGRIEGLPALE